MKKKPLSEKELGKRPLVQSHAQPRVEQMPPPKKTQANAPQVEETFKKKEKSDVATFAVAKVTLLLHALSVTYPTPS